MEPEKDSLNNQTRQAKIEQMWLNYYNNALLEKGLITESEYRQMQVQINTRKGSLTR